MRAAGRLAMQALVDTLSHVEKTHRATAARVFTLTDPARLPARLVHDGITAGVYTLIRGAGLLTGMAATEMVAVAAGSSLPAGSTPRSNLALAILNAGLGDELADQDSPLAIRMAVRHGRADVAPDRDSLALAFPEASPKVAVFIHGLGENEESWRLHGDRHRVGAEATYGSRLAEDLGYTPVYLRYNTGLHISENGRYLAALLDAVAAAWPARVAELLLVGHSMGGLVARSACHQAKEAGTSWVSAVRDVVYLGSPHLGAGLELWVSHFASALGKLAESRALASILDRRSAGIKDLRAGSLLDDDWRDPDRASKRKAHEVPLIPWANHYVISAAITTSHRNPLGRLVGDLLVQPASARGRSRDGRHIPFLDEHKRHFDGLHHFDLLNHPSVYRAIREWLDPASSAESDAGSALVGA